jgi:hypothetical protein
MGLRRTILIAELALLRSAVAASKCDGSIVDSPSDYRFGAGIAAISLKCHSWVYPSPR